MFQTRSITFATIVGLLAIGCAAEDIPAPEPATTTASTTKTADPAVTRLLEGGDFRFSMMDSAIIADVRAKCEASASQVEETSLRAKQVAGCLEEVTAEAAGEGIEISPLGDGRVRYLSYVTGKDGERKTHLEAEVTVVAYEEGIVELTEPKMIHPTGAPPADVRFFVEVVSDRTIAMDKVPGAHPRKGNQRLIFHRSQP